MSHETVYVVGHRNPDADSICSAIAYAHLKRCLGAPNVEAARAGDIDDETAYVLRYFDVPTPELLTDARGLQLILVDHCDIAQALPHIEDAHVLEVWDHHGRGDLGKPRPMLIFSEPVGATATLIAERYLRTDTIPTRPMAGVLIAGILSDTIVFRSPNVTARDRHVVSCLAPNACIDPMMFGDEMLEIKTSAAERMSPEKVVKNDLKTYRFDGYRVGIAQVKVRRPEMFIRRHDLIAHEMRDLRDQLGLAQFILMVTDVESMASDLWFVGDRSDLFERAFGRQLEQGRVRIAGCLSRKTQVVPRLDMAFQLNRPIQTTASRD